MCIFVRTLLTADSFVPTLFLECEIISIVFRIYLISTQKARQNVRKQVKKNLNAKMNTKWNEILCEQKMEIIQ